MHILIPVSAIRAARKLLTRVRFERLKLPALSHVLATLDAAGLTLAVTDLDHWLETRIPASIQTTPPTKLIQPEPAGDFPVRPAIQGRITAVPKETLLALSTVAGCASTDTARYILNGVLFSPDKGGILIATDGRRLAGTHARVPGREFILPNAAVQVLGFPDFTGRDAAILQPEAGEGSHVQFRSGPHTLSSIWDWREARDHL